MQQEGMWLYKFGVKERGTSIIVIRAEVASKAMDEIQLLW